MKVLIVTGGNTSERKISLISAKAAKQALEQNGYNVKMFDLKRGYDQLKEMHKGFAVIFPVLHGKEGEDGTLYKFLKSLNRPHIGVDPKGSKIAFDKILHKRYLEKNKIPTAGWEIIKNAQDIVNFGFPCFLKASQGGSSREVALLESKKDLRKKRVMNILNLPDQFLVEDTLKGVEITAAILNNEVLPLIEIVPPEGEWFDYKNKYSGTTKEIVGAPSLKEKVKKHAQEIALKIHADLKLGHYSRTDFIVIDDTPYVLETNTANGIGFTPESLFPKAAKGAGISFKQLVHSLVQRSLQNI